MTAKCRHLSIAEEAYRQDAATGVETPFAAFICGWPDTLPTMPAWMVRRVGGGSIIDPHLDCAACSCFQKGPSV